MTLNIVSVLLIKSHLTTNSKPSNPIWLFKYKHNGEAIETDVAQKLKVPLKENAVQVWWSGQGKKKKGF